MGSIRVLQFVADTDPDPAADAALALHQRLADRGLEVRTLALAPGNRAGHEALLPVIAPSRRSLAARTGVQTERRWADVVVLHGPRALVSATLPPRSSLVPTVYAGPGAFAAEDLGCGGRVAERFARRLAAVVSLGELPADATGLDAHSSAGPSSGGPSSAGRPRTDVLRIPFGVAAGADWADLLEHLVASSARRNGG